MKPSDLRKTKQAFIVIVSGMKMNKNAGETRGKTHLFLSDARAQDELLLTRSEYVADAAKRVEKCDDVGLVD